MSSHLTTAPATNMRTSVVYRPVGQNIGTDDRNLAAVTVVAAENGTDHIGLTTRRRADTIVRIDPVAMKQKKSWKRDSACPEMMKKTIMRGEMRSRTTPLCCADLVLMSWRMM